MPRPGGPATRHAGLTDAGWAALRVVHNLADERSGRPSTAFHPHGGTYVETPAEVDRSSADRPGRVGICLDVGHYTVGGGTRSQHSRGMATG